MKHSVRNNLPYSSNTSDQNDMLMTYCGQIKVFVLFCYAFCLFVSVLIGLEYQVIKKNPTTTKINQICVVKLLPGLKLFLFCEFTACARDTKHCFRDAVEAESTHQYNVHDLQMIIESSTLCT